jgi:hypothetical protein
MQTKNNKKKGSEATLYKCIEHVPQTQNIQEPLS